MFRDGWDSVELFAATQGMRDKLVSTVLMVRRVEWLKLVGDTQEEGVNGFRVYVVGHPDNIATESFGCWVNREMMQAAKER